MKKITLDKSQIYTGNLILVNSRYPILEKNHRELVSIGAEDADIRMEREAAEILQEIFEEMKCQECIVPVSGYRTLEEQTEIYKDSLRDNGKTFTEKYVALPNHSEHQTGLAIDLGLKKEKIDFIRPDFPYEGICDAFRKEAVKYGFVERYEKDKEAVTGIAHEPWHFRYVGYPHSRIMHDKKLSLEEYMDYIKNYTFDGKHIKMQKHKKTMELFYVPFTDKNHVEILIPEDFHEQISGNNMDGVIVTLWRDEHE